MQNLTKTVCQRECDCFGGYLDKQQETKIQRHIFPISYYLKLRGFLDRFSHLSYDLTIDTTNSKQINWTSVKMC